MTDVRLTAINPADSSVVPVACNDKGELKLEDPIPFDGNLDGNLHVTGSIKGDSRIDSGNFETTNGGVLLSENGFVYIRINDSFTEENYHFKCFRNGTAAGDEVFSVKQDGSVTTAGSASFAGSAVNIASNGFLSSERTFDGDSASQVLEINSSVNKSFLRGFVTGAGSSSFEIRRDGSISAAGGSTRVNSVGSLLVGTTSDAVGDAKASIDSFDGSAYLQGIVQAGGSASSGGATGIKISSDGFVHAARTGQNGNVVLWAGYTVGNSSATSLIQTDGSAQFAGGKAGITAEGFFWCTTRGGDTVILDSISGGSATWAAYSPPTRAQQIKDRIKDAISPVPSQDLPESPQIRE